MTIEEYEKEFPDNMVFYDDKYYSSVDDCLESVIGEISLTWLQDKDMLFACLENLKYIYGTEKNSVELDAESIIVDLEENSNLEDWEVDNQGRKEFKEFVIEWNKRYGTGCYMASDVVIMVPDELKREYLN